MNRSAFSRTGWPLGTRRPYSRIKAPPDAVGCSTERKRLLPPAPLVRSRTAARVCVTAGPLWPGRGGFLAAQFFGENDRVGQVLHGAAKPAAFVPHSEISLFLGQVLTPLQ